MEGSLFMKPIEVHTNATHVNMQKRGSANTKCENMQTQRSHGCHLHNFLLQTVPQFFRHMCFTLSRFLDGTRWGELIKV